MPPQSSIYRNKQKMQLDISMILAHQSHSRFKFNVQQNLLMYLIYIST
jgi:hypothetical protein